MGDLIGYVNDFDRFYAISSYYDNFIVIVEWSLVIVLLCITDIDHIQDNDYHSSFT